MINTFPFGGLQQVMKDGKRVLIHAYTGLDTHKFEEFL